jgi:hypothetical protein
MRKLKNNGLKVILFSAFLFSSLHCSKNHGTTCYYCTFDPGAGGQTYQPENICVPEGQTLQQYAGHDSYGNDRNYHCNKR